MTSHQHQAQSNSWLIINLLLSLWLTSLAAAESDADRFKAFLHDPPLINSVVFKLKSPGDSPLRLKRTGPGTLELNPTATRKLDPRVWGLDSNGFKLYLGRWQPNAFILRQVVQATEIGETNGFLSCGHYESNYWVLRGGTLQTTVWPELSEAATNYVYTACLAFEQLLARVLNMGVMDVDIGTIGWDSNKFNISSSRVRGVNIIGNALFHDDRIEQMDLLYNQYPYQILYEYEEPLSLSFLPSGYKVSYLGSKGPELRSEVRLVSVETSNDPLPASFFDPVPRETSIVVDNASHALHARIERHWIYTNNNVALHLWTNGQLVPVPRSTDFRPPKHRLVWFTAIWIILLAGPLFAIFGRKSEQRQRKTK